MGSQPDTVREGLEVTPQEASRLRSAGAPLLDVREDAELQQASLPGACHIPMRQIEERLDEIEEVVLAGQPLLVLCHHGQRSLRATLALHAYGIASARSIAGGIDRWSTDVDGAIPRYQGR